MKHGQLRAIGHNIADSIASGFLLGFPTDVSVHEIAQNIASGALTLDMLRGGVAEADAPVELFQLAGDIPKALEELCSRHGASLNDFRELQVRYFWERGEQRFAVTVQDQRGRCSTTEYRGLAGRRLKSPDTSGRGRREGCRTT